jgi:Dullard-like phosphatase family protein
MNTLVGSAAKSSLRRGSPRLLQVTLRLTKSNHGSQMTSMSSWSHARNLRTPRTSLSQQRQHRPLGANGEAVAFNVKDLGLRQQQQHQQQQLSFYPSAVLPQREYESDLIVVLDMDECLIHSKFLSNPGAKFAHQLLQQQHQQEHSQEVESFRVTLRDGDLVHVYKRPFLDEFLQQVTSRYETHIFTAAMEIYAKPVLDTLDPTGTMFAKRWYRETCSYDATNDAYVKNLNRLVTSPEQHGRMVLIDNNPFSFFANPSNGILVSSFYDDPNDTTLLSVMKLLEELPAEGDVRPVLEQRFGLPKALQQIQHDLQSRTSKSTAAATVIHPAIEWPQKPAALAF